MNRPLSVRPLLLSSFIFIAQFCDRESQVPKTHEDKNGFSYMDRQQAEGNGCDAFCPAPETSVTENNLMEETVLRF